ncbi:hypothetical protein BHE74_00055153 [Ensete ventricosum]|uniref:Uncharacterized protein n=1 Tax=Ensete ventricosum TaxID=4639 RepID=A0A426YYN2_ENSVE|nr:hypothetical protein B296_00012250 [Ensete ventricosum]RWW30525.1 hypothetical protein GW17_00004902 [Ensete ventricosum]RWW39510.1 hypothetical protein BHE74_00055153 [Ensete ventricosum]RZS07111.1 hypothetical protein BHM03_00037891 [Ensete ventricosum]
MRRPAKLEAAVSLGRKRTMQGLLAAAILYVALVFLFEFPVLFRRIPSPSSSSIYAAAGLLGGDSLGLSLHLGAEDRHAPLRPSRRPHLLRGSARGPTGFRLPSDRRRSITVSGLDFRIVNATAASRGPFSGLDKIARDAWEVGRNLLEELKVASFAVPATKDENRTEDGCPHSIILSGEKFLERGRVMVIPCGLTLGSHITLVAKPYHAHPEYDPKIATLSEGEKEIMVSQFMMELQGLKTVDGEDPPRILHFNPRLKGDWSGRPVIEQNTCYRMQWGSAQRCEGWKSMANEETGGLLKLPP